MSTTVGASTRSSRRPGRPLQIQLPSFLRSRLSRIVMIVIGVLLAYALPLIRPPFITTPASNEQRTCEGSCPT